MFSPPLGVGLIGTGLIAAIHARAFASLPEFRLTGVVSRSRGKAKEFAATHGASFATDSINELCAHPDVQIVCIGTPSGAHLEPALAAIQAGKHVIIEKPLEISVERVDALLAAAKQHRVLVAPIFQGRFGAGAQKVKKAIASGQLGRLVLATVHVKWHRPDSYYQGWKGMLALDGGGAVMNQAIHGLDLLQWFAGLPSEVFAWTTRRVHTRIEAEDTACAALRFSDGALGTIEATTAAFPGWSRRIELCGEKGSVSLEDDRIARWDLSVPLADELSVESAFSNALGSGASSPGGIGIEGHVRQFRDIADTILHGRPLTIDGHEARRAVALVEALYASAQTGRPISLLP